MFAAILITLGSMSSRTTPESYEVHYLGQDENDQVLVCHGEYAKCLADDFMETWSDFEARRIIAETK